MTQMTLAYALYFQCPQCGQHVDVGEASAELRPEEARAVARAQGIRGMEGTCAYCRKLVSVPVSALRSRVRN